MLDSRLRYRRQFVLGPRCARSFLDVPELDVAPGLVAQVHPELGVHRVETQGLRLTLLGYAIDPEAPDRDDHDILQVVGQRAASVRDVPEAMLGLTGRWVLIADDGTDLILLNDPCGLREVFYTRPEFGETWCASQASRIADELDLETSPQAASFMDSTYFRRHHEPWWPGGTTQWAELHRLQPNHYLDLNTRRMHRFWPNATRPDLEPDEAAHIGAAMLRRIVHAGARRFDLALPLTAGMDSRSLLAATRGLNGVWHYTALHAGLHGDSPDIHTARQLLSQVGRVHHVIKCPRRMSSEFAEIYCQNTTPAHESAGAIAEGLFHQYSQQRVSMSGHCSEIARDTFGISHTPSPDGAALAMLMGMQDNPYAIEQFGRWLEDAGPVAERYGHRVWDLFFWEQEYGTWAANGQAQWDLVHERFTPFNHRALLTVLLAVDPSHRQGPDYPLYEMIIGILWPELLREPFNSPPRSFDARVRNFARRMFRRRSGVDFLRALSRRTASPGPR
jgi:hypothetical protein